MGSNHCLPIAVFLPLHYLQFLQPAYLAFLSSYSQTVYLIVFLELFTSVAEPSDSEIKFGGFFFASLYSALSGRLCLLPAYKKDGVLRERI